MCCQFLYGHLFSGGLRFGGRPSLNIPDISLVAPLIILHESEPMVAHIHCTKHKPDTFNKHITHSDDCISTYTSPLL